MVKKLTADQKIDMIADSLIKMTGENPFWFGNELHLLALKLDADRGGTLEVEFNKKWPNGYGKK